MIGLNKIRKERKVFSDLNVREKYKLYKKQEKEAKVIKIKKRQGRKKGFCLSEETKKKISNALKGNKNPMYRKHHTEEAKEKIRQVRLKTIFSYTNTKIERLVQEELTNRGYAFYTQPLIFGLPDLAFLDQKIAIFIDGCYWHSCPECNKGRVFVKVINRDDKVNEVLKRNNWIVLRFWEHEINNNVKEVADKIENLYLTKLNENKTFTEVD